MELIMKFPDMPEMIHKEIIQTFKFSNTKDNLISSDEDFTPFDFIMRSLHDQKTNIVSCENPFYECKFYLRLSMKRKRCCSWLFSASTIEEVCFNEEFYVHSREFPSEASKDDQYGNDARCDVLFYI